jgi:uncharacterized protein (AIM24 family)
MPEIIDCGGKISIKIDESKNLFVRRDKMIQSDGMVRIGIALPSPQQATIARLINNLFWMQRITAGQAKGTITLTCPGGKRLIAIGLAHNERLAISFSHLVGFSKKPRFVSFANLSVAAFACDRNFATVVHGPTQLILESDGNHNTHTVGQVVLDPDQLIAWDPSTRFRLDKIHNVTDLYLNRVRISCTLTTELMPIIADSASKPGSNSTNPLLGFMKSVYWPRLH